MSLREALTCRSCGGSGYFGKDYWSQDESDCPDCVDGIPRDLIESVEDAFINRHPSFDVVRQELDFASVLVALRDKEEPRE